MEILKVLPKQLQKLPPLFFDFQPPGEFHAHRKMRTGPTCFLSSWKGKTLSPVPSSDGWEKYSAEHGVNQDPTRDITQFGTLVDECRFDIPSAAKPLLSL